MPKKKKTREQKILAEIRRRQQVVSHEGYTYSVHTSTENKKQAQTTQMPVSKDSATYASYVEHYSYLIVDFRKTAIVTLIVLILELVLHSFLK